MGKSVNVAKLADPPNAGFYGFSAAVRRVLGNDLFLRVLYLIRGENLAGVLENRVLPKAFQDLQIDLDTVKAGFPSLEKSYKNDLNRLMRMLKGVRNMYDERLGALQRAAKMWKERAAMRRNEAEAARRLQVDTDPTPVAPRNERARFDALVVRKLNNLVERGNIRQARRIAEVMLNDRGFNLARLINTARERIRMRNQPPRPAIEYLSLRARMVLGRIQSQYRIRRSTRNSEQYQNPQDAQVIAGAQQALDVANQIIARFQNDLR